MAKNIQHKGIKETQAQDPKLRVYNNANDIRSEFSTLIMHENDSKRKSRIIIKKNISIKTFYYYIISYF